jgi:arabinogalactan endo-1,4-beta-galactosidase
MMKKQKIMILFFLIFIYTLAFSVDFGDVNGDGSINIIDALVVAQNYVGLQPNPFYGEAADIDENGSIDIVDALLIARYYVGLIPLPTQSTTPIPSQTTGPTNPPGGDSDFMIGADISWVQENEDNGQRYYDNGVQKDILEILKDHKFNCIRLRLFHNPSAPGGYSSRGYCGLDKTIQYAKRIKAAGMKFLLDFHYSDTWADPGKQYKPSAWEGLSFDQLENAVYEYTRDVINQCRNQGVLPEIVQIGNEIQNGIIHPDGKSNNWNNFGRLLKAGVRGVQDVDRNILIMLHIATGGDNSASRLFIDNAITQGVYFDVMGFSCYPEWHGQPSAWQSNLTDIAQRYEKRIVIAEYSEYKQEANRIVYNLPNRRGLGTFIWEPTRWHETIFNSDGSTNSLIDIYVEIAAQVGL